MRVAETPVIYPYVDERYTDSFLTDICLQGLAYTSSPTAQR